MIVRTLTGITIGGIMALASLTAVADSSITYTGTLNNTNGYHDYTLWTSPVAGFPNKILKGYDYHYSFKDDKNTNIIVEYTTDYSSCSFKFITGKDGVQHIETSPIGCAGIAYNDTKHPIINLASNS